MKLGQSYRLNTGSKVTLLETPPDLRRRARARIRFETGVKRDEEAELACVRISEPWDGPVPPRVSSQPRALPEYTTDHRQPRSGDIVKWTTTAAMIWDVIKVDEAQSVAIISGEVLAQRQVHTVPIDQLTVVHRTAPTKPILSPVSTTASTVPASTLSSEPDGHLAPEQPRRRLEEILDSLLFTSGCLEEYRRRCSPQTPKRDIADTLRSEIRVRGYIPDDHRGKPLRLRVDHRFEVVLPEMADTNDIIPISKLRYLSRRKGPSSGR
jgi:hypothetical protein